MLTLIRGSIHTSVLFGLLTWGIPLQILFTSEAYAQEPVPEEVDADLVIRDVDASGLSTDPRTLQVSGSIEVEIANEGTEGLTNVFQVLFFEDRGLDGSFDAGIDPVLGVAAVAGGLPAGDSLTVGAGLSGTTFFRDNLVGVFVDSTNAVLETEEGNNTLLWSVACDFPLAAPDAFGAPGSVFLTAHDPDFHVQEGGATQSARNILEIAIDFALNGSTDPLLVVQTNGASPNPLVVPPGHRNPIDGLDLIGANYVQMSAQQFLLADLDDFGAILVPSDFGGLLSQEDLDALIARSDDILAYLNNGGGLVAMAESGDGASDIPEDSDEFFKFLPFVESRSLTRTEVGNRVTSFGASLGLTDTDVNGNFSHNIFTRTGGLLPVDVDPQGGILSLAFRGHFRSDGVVEGPDLSLSFVRVDQTNCPESVDLIARVGNGGLGPVAAGVPVTFYADAPDGDVIGTVRTSRTLAPGEFEDVRLTWPEPPEGPRRIFAEVDRVLTKNFILLIDRVEGVLRIDKNHIEVLAPFLPLTLGDLEITSLEQAEELLRRPIRGDQSLMCRKQLLALKMNLILFGGSQAVFPPDGRTLEVIVAEADALLIAGGSRRAFSACSDLLASINEEGIGVETEPGFASPRVTLTADPDGVLTGEPVTFRIDTVLDPSVERILFANLRVGSQFVPVEDGEAVFVPDTGGIFTVTVEVTDAAGGVGSDTTLLTVGPDTTPPTVSLSASAMQVFRGEPVTFQVHVSDDVVSRKLFVDGECVRIEPDGTATFVPETTGDFTATVTVEDFSGNTASASVALVVIAPDLLPPAVSVVANPTTVVEGNSVTLTVSAIDNNAVSALSLEVDGQPVSLDGNGIGAFTPAATGTFTAVATAVDPAGNVGTATATIEVVPVDREAPSVVVETPRSGDILAREALILASVTDLGGAGIDTIEFLLDGNVVASGSVNFTILDTTLFTDGPHVLTVRATDEQANVGTSAAVGVFIDNTGPAASLVAPPAGSAHAGFVTLEADADDGAGSGVARVEFFVDGLFVGSDTTFPYSVRIDTRGFADGIHRITLRTVDQATNVAVSPPVEILLDNTPPEVTLTIDPAEVDLTDAVPDEVSIRVVGVDAGGGAVTLEAFADGRPIALDAEGRAVFTPRFAGETRIEARGTDRTGNAAVDRRILTAIGPDDTILPTVEILSPSDSEEIRGFTEFVATSSDPNLVEFTLTLTSSRPGFAPVVIAEGDASVVNEAIATFDPTVLRNDAYRLTLTATDINRNTASASVQVRVTGELKIGNFRITQQDLVVPVAGIPIILSRTYDSLNRSRSKDFGFGWEMDLSDVDVREDDFASVVMALPDGRRSTFAMTPTQVNPFDPRFFTAGFTATSGVQDRLDFVGDHDLILIGGEFFTFDLEDFDPDQYVLTRVEGTVFEIDQRSAPQLRRITDRNGNFMAFTRNGITHSAGKSVTFVRDAQDRIVEVVDPAGKSISYQYDAAGNLVVVTDREGNPTTFDYTTDHNFLSVEDPRGITPLINEFDPVTGRLVAHIDANGNRIEFDHRIGDRQEVVTDRLGNPTAIAYDGRGLVVAQTNALAETTAFAHDADENLVSTTDPLGNTTTSTYDGRGNERTRTDPLGNTVTRTYNGFGQVLTETDARGNTTLQEYDAAGNNVRTVAADGGVTVRTFDTQGNLLTETDPEGHTVVREYDVFGYLIREVDAEGNETLLAYDDLGREIRRMQFRVVGGSPEILVTETVYDANGRVIETIDPEGGSTRTEYDPAGLRSAAIDPNGVRNEFDYTPTGQLLRTRYADGTEEVNEYDAADRRVAAIDRGGRRTETVYDAVGRVVKTIHPDGSFTETVYDAAGRVVVQRDERGNSTFSEYDAAGRRTAGEDALGNRIESTFDANGNEVSTTDARGFTTARTFDVMNRLVRIDLPDGTFTTQAFNLRGEKVSETDEAGETVEFEYTPRGQLAGVIQPEAIDPSTGQPARPATTYAYDEQGLQVSQTDALGRTTTYAYDLAGRRTSRTLPLGQAETTEHDPAGNPVALVDFEGQRVDRTFDSNNRLVSKIFIDGVSDGTPDITFTWTPVGQKASETDARGTTTFTYDSRDRLTRQDNPDGSFVENAYDSAGNRVRVETASRIVTQDFDALDRLIQVNDATGVTTYTYDANGNRETVTLPNGIRTTHQYDSRNRLTFLENRDLSTATVLSSYAYTLSPTGQRVQVVESDGRRVDYAYDPLQRLTGETISDPAGPDDTVTYTLDLVGNRLEKDSFAEGRMDYVYNDNDGLETEFTPSGRIDRTYDLNGSTVREAGPFGTRTYEFNFEKRLARALLPTQTIEYHYDQDGIRVEKDVNGTVTTYTIDKRSGTGFDQVLEERTGSGALLVSYVFGDDLLAQERTSDPADFYLYDGQMSVRQLADSTASVTDTYDYDAFGITIQETGTTVNAYRYTGEQLDPELGFYYLRARYLDPFIGRFLSIDPVEGIQEDPATLHKYLYAGHDPVNRMDPGGEFSLVGFVSLASIIGLLSGLISGTLSVIAGGSFAVGFLGGLISGSLGTVLGAFLPLLLAVSLATTISQFVIELITGGFDLEPELAIFRIGFAAVLGLVTGSLLSRIPALAQSGDELINIFTALGVRESLALLGKEFSKLLFKGLSFGTISTAVKVLGRVVKAVIDVARSLGSSRRRDLERQLREISPN